MARAKLQVNPFDEIADDALPSIIARVIRGVHKNILSDPHPVRTGHARASWFTQVNDAPASHPNPPPRLANSSGGRAYTGPVLPAPPAPPFLEMVAAARDGAIVTIANSADYINALEYGHPSAAGWVRAASAPGVVQALMDQEIKAHQARVDAAARKASRRRKKSSA